MLPYQLLSYLVVDYFQVLRNTIVPAAAIVKVFNSGDLSLFPRVVVAM